ncbi:gamma-glutamyl phosphate reductase [Salinicoccus sediminis]|uniref:Gamma-glutamyl phosphate reductase n=2 Tax=Salinicoccus sediminis TaxID=1432562 RepID=A0A0M2SJY6_9STAP|nr:gamma-glutamyl phosphate reductase [Salinicoccus sediminis]
MNHMTENVLTGEAVIENLGTKAKHAAKVLRKLSAKEKNTALEAMIEGLKNHTGKILEANSKDIENGKNNGLGDALIERLTLNEERLAGMQDGLRQMTELTDPTTQNDGQWVNEQGLKIGKVRVPLGVIGIIYESRPNVTVDASGLCLKAGNAVILRGGKEAMNSNRAIVEALQEGLSGTAVPKESVQLITDPSRELAAEFMQANEHVDCLIPRGGAGLIQTVLKQATVPVIETGTGNCHLYVHESADPEMAKSLLINSKTHRVSVCNALETLLIDDSVAEKELPALGEALLEAGVGIHGDEKTCSLIPEAVPATEADYSEEYLGYEIAVKVVDGYEAAIDHIDGYSTGHSDVIAATDYQTIQNFLNEVDSAAVYVNASTRFTDGEMFGFGGEIGISTQKLHARGPMGLEALTSYKYVVEGSGQIRE